MSLDNFNENAGTNGSGGVLSSPRSLEACRRVGVLPSELLIRTIDDMRDVFKDKLHEEKHLKAKLAIFEEKRKAKLVLSKVERETVKEEERRGTLSFDASGAPFVIIQRGWGGVQAYWAGQVEQGWTIKNHEVENIYHQVPQCEPNVCGTCF